VSEYQQHLGEIAKTIQTKAIAGEKPTMMEVVNLLRFDEDNRVIRDLCVVLQIGSKSDFNREMNRKRQRDVLDTAPANATELVAAFAKKFNLHARMDGLMIRDVKAVFRDDNGNETPILPGDRAAPDVDLYAVFHCDAKARMNRLDLERELRTLSANLRMNISAQDILDAVEEWMKDAARARLHDIFVGIDGVEPTSDAARSWKRFAEQVFDCSETSPEFVAAVLRKFMWQVKRKIRGLPISDHLMPVLLGPQGIGKSTLVNQMIGPVEELKLNVDFRMITDERNVEIWDSFVMFLDEMGYASKADIDTVKNIITSSTLTRRPMRSNGRVTINQNATFIGCSNRELAQLVRDPTGNRRFVGLRMRSDADRAFINAIDWPQMWGSVSINEADPMANHRATLAGQQEETRERSRVEQWMIDFDGTATAYHAGISKSGNIAAIDLYDAFREFEERAYPGHFKTSKTDWEFEMARLRKNAPDAVIFEKKRGNGGVVYRWRRESHLRVVE
jgi:energy-coupling factor transporter ATP-binding protein EcfA2